MLATPTTREQNPLVDASPAQVPLPRAPLVRVIAQVKFSEVLGVENPDLVARFQDAISQTYGVLTREAGINMSFAMPVIGLPQQHPMTHWRFTDHPTEWQWRVTLTSQFITLESTRYTNRDDFFERLETLLEAVEQHIRPTMMIRLGVRYINRITGHELRDASLLVRPEISGVVGTVMADSVNLSVSETVFNMGSQKMTARSGMLPPNVTIDPAAILPINEACFLLDLDVFDETAVGFNSHEIARTAKQFAERSYAFFRWAVTDEFLIRFGAEQ
jgi:uncharacterized protein (TIGR04255 family)